MEYVICEYGAGEDEPRLVLSVSDDTHFLPGDWAKTLTGDNIPIRSIPNNIEVLLAFDGKQFMGDELNDACDEVLAAAGIPIAMFQILGIIIDGTWVEKRYHFPPATEI